MLDRSRNLLHIHIPKTAGTSLKSVLFGSETPTLHQPAGAFTVEEWESAYSFACVRNPYDRAVSSYVYHVKSGYRGRMLNQVPDLKQLTFREYLEHFVVGDLTSEIFMTQVGYIDHPVSDKPIDLVMKFESLSADYARLRSRVCLPDHLPHELRTKRQAYRSYYAGPERSLVEQRYGVDLARFDYVF